MRTEMVYRAHCRELRDRVGRHEATAAECGLALADTSAQVS